MNLRVLIVEDEEPQREALKAILCHLGDSEKQLAGIEKVEVDLAACADDARRLLDSATSKNRPYDIMLLDLGLPEKHGEGDKPEVGLEILKYAKKRSAARGVIIISVFTDLDRFVVPAFQLGATDFFGKPYAEDEVPKRVLAAWKQVKLRLLRTEQQLLIKNCLYYADKNISYRYGSSLSRFMQVVRHETKALRKLNLAPDEAKKLNESLTELEVAANQTKTEWKKLHDSFEFMDEGSQSLVVEQTLVQLAEELRPCLTINVNPESFGETRILSFHDGPQDNVQLIFREILVGSLSEINETDDVLPRTVAVNIMIENGTAVLQFKDDLEPIDDQLAQRITDGEIIVPRTGQWRAWGLSVVQHLALRGGGRLFVEPQSSGNLITYRATLVDS